jgi:hypothetical protein
MEIKNDGTTLPRIKMNMNSKSLLKECALCGNQIKNSTSTPVEESIGGTSYIFDTRDCAIMFKRFHAIYGDDFEALSFSPAS